MSRDVVASRPGSALRLTSLLLHHLHQPDVDVLPAAGLLAVDGDRVRARPSAPCGLRRSAAPRRSRSCSPPTFAASTPLMYTSASSSWWMRSSTSPVGTSFSSNVAAQPDVGRLPLGADDRARRALRAEAAVALGPLRGVEVRLLPAVGGLRRSCTATSARPSRTSARARVNSGGGPNSALCHFAVSADVELDAPRGRRSSGRSLRPRRRSSACRPRPPAPCR